MSTVFKTAFKFAAALGLPAVVLLLVSSVHAGGADDYIIEASSTVVEPGTTGETVITLDHPEDVEAYSFGLVYDSNDIDPLSAEVGSAVLEATGPAGPDFFFVDLMPASVPVTGNGLTVACILSLSFPIVTIPAGIQQEITAITFDCLPSATPGAEIVIDFSDQLGDPQILLVASVIGQDQFLVPFSGLITVFEEPPPPTGPSFVRGDANGDGALDISDPVRIGVYVARGVNQLACLAAGDVDDDGLIQLSDVVLLLTYLFSDGAAPAAPYPDCGADPTTDLECLNSPCQFQP
ncbi:MAG: hypothetical protein ACPHP7_09535 [Planctomycetota bacterium]